MTSEIFPHPESRIKTAAEAAGGIVVGSESRVRHSVTPAPVSRVRYGHKPTPEVAEEVDRSMNFDEWELDASYDSRCGSYATEFVRRLVDDEVVEYRKNGEPRFVVGKKYNDDDSLKYLKISFRASEGDPIQNRNIFTNMSPENLTARIADEPGLFTVPKPVPAAE